MQETMQPTSRNGFDSFPVYPLGGLTDTEMWYEILETRSRCHLGAHRVKTPSYAIARKSHKRGNPH
ncbi:hypothetical protein H5410_023095 [Solanum commersonii]|uniref:Uncharacterized protein n=1 Tax=Solanum commersonii TaxID=4109 RepID=A0A9J5ZJX9_SOLCO|nr:hypothetical protein H5410_023095 [Solanum commersonii]